jgi:hypothetical protein
VRPLIHLSGARLDDFLPGAAVLHQRHAVRHQHALDLGARHFRVLDDEQVHQVLDVGQVIGGE